MKVQVHISLYPDQPLDAYAGRRIDQAWLLTGRCAKQSSVGPPIDAITRCDVWINNKLRISCTV